MQTNVARMYHKTIFYSIHNGIRKANLKLCIRIVNELNTESDIFVHIKGQVFLLNSLVSLRGNKNKFCDWDTLKFFFYFPKSIDKIYLMILIQL